jgi:hypothetical protein
MDGNDRRENARTSTTKLTDEDFLLFPDDGQRHELIDGEHYVTPSPSSIISDCPDDSPRLCCGTCVSIPRGELFYAPLDCVFTSFDIVEPDVLLVTNNQRHILTRDALVFPIVLIHSESLMQ